jgi:hypothetical protein
MSDKLRGMKLPVPHFLTAALPEDLKHVNGYSNLQTFFPSLTKIFRLNKYQTENVCFDLPWMIDRIDCSGTQGPCQLVLGCKGEKRTIPAFLKVTHLLDPVRWMQGHYSLPKEPGLPWHSKTWTAAWHKLQNPWNQAYVETVATYALGRLRKENVSPHFNEFYGAFCAKADTYRYNINDDFSSFRENRWFWNGKQRGLYDLHVLNPEAPAEPVPQDVLDEFLTQPDLSDDKGSEEEVEMDDIEVEDASLESMSMDDMDYAKDEEEDESVADDLYTVYAEIKKYPVMMIFTESNKDTMDSLLNPAVHDCAPGSEAWETMWSAWIFQIIAATCVMQKVLGMTHNDLHTNNIVWVPTDQEFLFYKGGNTYWKIPTYGKLFRIIDFGRSIFQINGTYFISDDFALGNDAAGQYNFSPLTAKQTNPIPPNPSFDLSRLAVSLFEALFPVKPADHESRRILSEEEGLIVRESVSPLYNVLWSWMIDSEDRNILMEPDGSERFPDFDLYKHIAEHVHSAEPCLQIYKAPFTAFQVSEIPASQTSYPLFV